MVLSVSHYDFSKSLSCPFLLLTLPQRCSYALYPIDSSLLSIYRLFKFRLRLHCLQIVNKRVRLHEYLKMCWTNTSPPTPNPLKVWHNIKQLTPLKSSWTTPTLLPTEKKAQKPTLCQWQRLFWPMAHISPGWFLRICTPPLGKTSHKKSISFVNCPKRGGEGLPEFFDPFFHHVVPYILTSVSCYVILFGHF